MDYLLRIAGRHDGADLPLSAPDLPAALAAAQDRAAWMLDQLGELDGRRDLYDDAADGPRRHVGEGCVDA